MPTTVTVDHATALPEAVDVIAIGVRSGSLADDAPGLDLAVATLAGFEGKVGQTLVAGTDDGVRLLVGLGAEPAPSDLRKVGAAAGKASLKQASLAIDALGHLDGTARADAAAALTEGLMLGTYRYADFKDAPAGTALTAVTVVAKGGKRVADAVGRGAAVAEAIALVRDLVNTPGGDLTPEAFAEHAVAQAAAAGLEVEVMDLAAITEAGLGGLLGVARGSFQEPRFVKLTHRPEGKPRGRVALVGKGVTFDSGGLSLKTATGMFGMKSDMAGAAAVLGAMTLVPTVAPRLEVTAYLPLTDNMTGPDATRPGDVLRARNGKTIEIANTDAEGRLILADALSLAVEDGHDAIVDLATLTGACMVALGDRTAGLMSNHKELSERIAAAAEDVDELVWPLPLPEHLRKTIDTEVADLRNTGTTAFGGALSAGLFLKEFVGDVPWAHLDIAGPADASAPYDEVTKGGTGFGVRTLARLLATWTRLPSS